jgi:hypothetical protein
MSKELQMRARELFSLMQHGCTDGHCKMRPRKGSMHTNGGCRCVGTLADLALDVASEADKCRRGSGNSIEGYIL